MDRPLPKTQIFLVTLILLVLSVIKTAAIEPVDFALEEGDMIKTSTNPDIFIINNYGYKRLFLNPEIFSFYGHLGGFQNVKIVTSSVENSFQLSIYFRNCESADTKVYTLELSSDDNGFLHWLDISANDALSQDPNFFKKVFCINNLEFDWYIKGEDLSSLNQLPQSLKDLPQAPSSSGTLTVDLKINGSDNPGSVKWGEELMASWTSTNTIRCTGLNYLVLKNSDIDIDNLPTLGSVSFYAKYDLVPILDTMVVQILCYDKDENYIDDFILLTIKQ